jgi:hypothetical protein
MGALSAVNPHGVGARYAELGNGELGLRLSDGDTITGSGGCYLDRLHGLTIQSQSHHQSSRKVEQMLTG